MKLSFIEGTCPYCNSINQFNLPEEVESSEISIDDLKDKKPMTAKCPNCNQLFFLNHDLKYLNKELNFDIYYCTKDKDLLVENLDKEKTNRIFLNDYLSFLEDIEILSNKMNDYVIYTYKMGLYDKLSKTNKKVESIHFEENYMNKKIFEAIVIDLYGSHEPHRIEFEEPFYEFLKEELKELSQRDSKLDYEINFDLINKLLSN